MTNDFTKWDPMSTTLESFNLSEQALREIITACHEVPIVSPDASLREIAAMALKDECARRYLAGVPKDLAISEMRSIVRAAADKHPGVGVLLTLHIGDGLHAEYEIRTADDVREFNSALATSFANGSTSPEEMAAMECRVEEILRQL